MQLFLRALIALLLLFPTPALLHGQDSAAAGIVAVQPGELAWQERDDGSLMAVLYGNPAAEGHYVLRFKLPPNWAGRPHTHGGAEIVTVYSGTMLFAYGDDLSREAARSFGPGAFVALPAGIPMRPYTGEEEVIVDVQGQGPFTVQYLDEGGGQGN
ncbi:MAG: cupin domain-containing protein [Candidatus Limnocylindria bacterium]